MKIAFLGLSSKRGGVETYAINMYEQIKKKNPKVSVSFLINKPVDYFDVEYPNDEFIVYPSRRESGVMFFNHVCEVFKKHQFDILWCNYCSLSNIVEIKAAYKYGIKRIILHSHNSQNMGSYITGMLHDINKRRVTRYVTDYFACSDLAAKWMFPDCVEYTIVNNAIDVDKYTHNEVIEQRQRERYSCQGKTVIGHVGRFHPQKNHEFLLDVFSEYLKLNSSAVLCLCGEGELREEIEKKVKRLGIQESVIFAGQVKDVSEIYQLFDVFLFPSLYEGLPFALLEAQAAGVPCLVSDTVSEEVKITNLINYESLQDTAIVWARRLSAVATHSKVSHKEEFVAANYELGQYANSLLERFGV